MIVELKITNYAIIESINVEFSDRLNVITGETGSGKSILLGALSLILGERADTKVLYNREKKCIVEGTFKVGRYELQSFFEENDLDYDDEVVIRREIAASGKSRAFINDTPVTLRQLRELTSGLVDLHLQFENSGINDVGYQLGMIDSVAKLGTLLTSYRDLYHHWRRLKAEAEALQKKQLKAIQDKDYLEFQIKEFDALEFDGTSDLELEQKLEEMENAQEIIQSLAQLSQALEEDEHSIIDQLKRLIPSTLANLRHHRSGPILSERLESVIIELEDIAMESNTLASDIQHDPEAVSELRSRMDKLNHLLHKHHVQRIEDLVGVESDIRSRLEAIENLDDQIKKIDAALSTCENDLEQAAISLSEARREVVNPFTKKVNGLLSELKMHHADFKIQLTKANNFLPSGRDHVEFLFAPNKGSAHFPIRKVASGGELSRLSLITKSLVAKSISLPTLIFDEVDSGISGDIAQRMGQILREMADHHQVVCITHTPQVAAKATKHFKVSKDASGKSTKAKISVLNQDESIYEIATMLSSSPPSASAIASATELISS